MAIFTEGEVQYLRSLTLGRLATVGRDRQPHVIPLTYRYNPDEETIDLGGIDFASGKKWRDVQHNKRVTFLVDGFTGTSARAVEVGEAEVHETGGSKINPRFPNFVEQFIRLRPKYIVSWGVDSPGEGKVQDFKPNARRVG